jgi:nicotinate-nucleotide adenylyltransferase
MEIALYFGSFNPVHIGHLIIATQVLNKTSAQQVWFVVSPQNPFKQSQSLLNEYDRLHLVNLAIEGNEKFRASNIEFQLPKPSYTATTLMYLKEKYPDHEFRIIMGSDSFQNITRWKNADSIVRNHKLLIYKRPGFEVDNTINANIEVMDAPLLEISATYIRELIMEKKSIKYLVPEKVEGEIERSRFYQLKKIP